MLQTSSIQGVFRVDFCPVVTNVVNPSAFSVKMLVFGLRLTTFVTEVLARRFESCWFDDVCNVGRPLVARPGLAAAHGYRSLALPPPAGIGNLSRETPVAFARSSVRGVETAIAFARAGRAPIETDIAFAGEKWAFWVRFSVAEVMVVSMVAVLGRAVVMAVSMVAVQGRAVVMVVSCWPEPVAVEVSLVASSPRGCVLCAKKFALLDLMCVRARNSSPCSLITPQIRHFCACRASIFAETRLEERCWASIFAEMPLGARCWASFFAIQQS